MKKIYSFFTLLVASLVSLTASAQTRTVTIHIDTPDNIQSVEVFNDDKYDFVPFSFTGDSFELEVSSKDNNRIKLYPAENCQISKITIGSGEDAKDVPSYYLSDYLPSTSTITAYLYDDYDGFIFQEGEEIYITTKAKENKVLTVVGNPEHISNVTFYNEDVTPTEPGKWVIDATSTDHAIKVMLKDDILIDKVTDKDGNEIQNGGSYTTQFWIWTNNYDSNNTFTVATKTADEDRTASMTVKVISGSFEDVSIKRKGDKNVELTSNEQIIKFNPETEVPFTFSNAKDYRGNLYKVTVVGNPEGSSVKKDTYSFTVTPTDGCVVEVDAAYPDKDVPVHFTFPNDGTEGAISELTVDDVALSQGSWLADNFTLKYGSNVFISYSNVYDIEKIVVNEIEQSRFVSFKVTEDEYNIEITATKQETKSITILCDAWEHITLSTSYGKYALTGSSTKLELPSTAYMLYYTAKDNYVISGIYDNDSNDNIAASGYFYFNDGQTIRIEAEKFERNKTLKVYIEETDQWYTRTIYLSHWKDMELEIDYTENGYHDLKFSTGDLAGEAISFFDNRSNRGVVYLNDKLLEHEGYGEYKGLSDATDGDVLKFFTEEKTPHTVTYDIAADVDVEVRHDHITSIDSPASHNVLPGTQIHIAPKAVSRAAASPIKVTVGTETIAPDNEGVFSVIADGDKTIKVEKNTVTGIDEINADSAAKIYDLQGRQVTAPGRGIYIVNGKKIKK